ncbi:nucleotidyl transferase AbiEii/AbiGii toxin family protein [Candidatus Sulfurimonas marisnigri]|uniref:Nucleotidyl transferase AbiEii/AbiGii toxin family protein n=1 Tax=Candidatus Sulfurimonas marisnigri TaxID=2740405 RepID=A0A7S7M326_9BACT|nr:nucleotidyl transferase AbiEii/AbiGii toxin family protein [Candidatus Sulfurimonas marisnigri]QOY55609.1 nucleotidyl transferase AbiEii/AbiGii toxin family protein [Candidatus Sulfurimonas marisnigri]
MTANVIKTLKKIQDLDLFNDDLYFIGGTALSYYINHRISEDIDVVSPNILNHKAIISSMLSINANKVKDENVFALRLAGLFPDEHMLKFNLDGVKVEFFKASRTLQLEILEQSSFKQFENSNIKILDLKSIAKLKIVALFSRDKSRDLFDFGAILDNNVLSIDEILEIAKKLTKIETKESLLMYINDKVQPLNDETVYLDEKERSYLSFIEIKARVLQSIESINES